MCDISMGAEAQMDIESNVSQEIYTGPLAYCPTCRVTIQSPTLPGEVHSCACGGATVGIRMVERPNKLFTYPIAVHGITFCIKSTEELTSDLVVLEREPGNVHHAKAIAIYMIGSEGKTKIGFVPRELADVTKDEELPRYGLIVDKGEPPWISARVEV